MAQRWSQSVETAQQGLPLLDRHTFEPAQEPPRIQSNRIKRKPVPSATTVSYGPPVIGPANNAGQTDTVGHDYSRLEDAQALSLEEFEVEGLPGTPSAQSAKPVLAEEARSSPRSTWLPYGLRTWFLIPMTTIAIALAAVCISLMSYSRSQYGLGTDDGQDSVLFGWRFSPTLVAVLYVLGTAIVLNDVKRTEAYARLSTPAWSAAKSTLCRNPGPWWDTYRRELTFDDKRVNWTMLSAALLYTVGFLAISPLSSSLLDSVGVTVRKPTTFEQVATQQNLPLAFDPREEVYLRTVAHTLQHLATSAWITDDYAVLPFYPTSSASVPLGPILIDQPQQWSAMTTVFKSVMTCEPMRLTETSASVYHEFDPDNGVTYNFTYLSINVSDQHGCDIRISSSIEDDLSRQLSGQGGGSWFLAPNFTIAVWALLDDAPIINFTAMS